MLLPIRFLLRTRYRCPYVPIQPDHLDRLDAELPATSRLDNLAALDGQTNFAEVYLGWNELGLLVRLRVRGKESAPTGDVALPLRSDGLSLWLDTRGDRTSHRATRWCHQFHFLAAGAGPERDQPTGLQRRINRALDDAPLASPSEIPLHLRRTRNGYQLDAFLGAALLNGFDPDQQPLLGMTYAVYDSQLGEQVLTVNHDFPFTEDPSLWSVVELVRPT